MEAAWAQAERADLCLALGSSITVSPASDLPAHVARRRGAVRKGGGRRRRGPDSGLVIVNLQATPCDSLATLRINGMVDDAGRPMEGSAVAEVMEMVEARLCT